MNKSKAIILTACSCILLAGCNPQPPKTSVEATTTTAVTTTTEATTTAEATTTTAVTTTTEVTTEAEEISETQVTSTTPDWNELTELTGTDYSTVNGPADVVIEKDVAGDLQQVFDKTKEILASGSYTYSAELTVYSDMYEGPVTMKAFIASSPDKGQYVDVNALFIVSRGINLPDGSEIIFDDENKTYCKTTYEESGMQFSADNSTGLIPITRNITSADIVEFSETGKRAYRYTVPADAIDDGYTTKVDTFIYQDVDTGMLCGIYQDAGTSVTKGDLYFEAGCDDTLFDLPADYTEITYAEYSQAMQAQYDSLFSSEE